MAKALSEGTGKPLGVLRRHETAYNLRSYYGEKFEQTFSFAFVRNPYDQVVSWYLYHHRLEQADHLQPHFDEWVKAGMPHGWGSCRIFKDRLWHNPFSQAEAPEPYDPLRLLCDPYTGELLVDFVGNFETLEQDWNTVCNELDVDIPLPHINASEGRGHYRSYYTEASRRIVEEKLGAAIEIFGYEF